MTTERLVEFRGNFYRSKIDRDIIELYRVDKIDDAQYKFCGTTRRVGAKEMIKEAICNIEKIDFNNCDIKAYDDYDTFYNDARIVLNEYIKQNNIGYIATKDIINWVEYNCIIIQ